MYHYYIWIELSESLDETDCGQLMAKIERLKKLVRSKLRCAPAEPFLNINYAEIFQCTGGANHRSTDHDALLDVLDHLVFDLPGSHGLVYWYDDELPGKSKFDGYRVIVVARGQWYERFDPFLSPRKVVVGD
ncbi:MAG: hypothetical protein CL946_03985 [Ectothiorhodospiraceae bacterium]|nr:hypothetical protein [Ectothiorhodospiraceae bacterium]